MTCSIDLPLDASPASRSARGCHICKMESKSNIMKASMRMRCDGRPRRRRRLDSGGYSYSVLPTMPKSKTRRSRGLHGSIKKNVSRPLLFVVCCSIFSFAFGWSPPSSSSSMQPQQLSTPMQQVPVQLYFSSHPTTASSSQLCASRQRPTSQSATPIDTKKKVTTSAEEPSIIDGVNQQMDILQQWLHNEESNDNDIVSTQPINILTNIMAIYTRWCTTDRPSPQLRFKASAHIDKAFRLVTNEAFSTPYQLSWVNLGVEVLQLQLHSGDFSSGSNIIGNSSINGEGRNIRLIPLQRPYNAIPKGTWLKALRALTSKDLNSSRSASSTRSIKTLSPKDEPQWIAPSNAAFRILQRLVKNKGIRTFYNKRRQQQMQNKQQSLDERDFNMVLHAYCTPSSHTTPTHQYAMHAAHRVMALQERTPHAPPLSPVAYSILLKAYGEWKDIKNVEMSILHAQRNGVVPDVVMANTVLDAYVNCGLLGRAQEVFRSMTRNRGRRVVQSTRDDGDEEEEVVGFWPLLKPNTRTFNTLLKGMAEEGDIRAAMKLSTEIQSKGLWDEITTNTLVKAAVTAHEFNMAETILTNHTVSTKNSQSRGRRDHPNVEAYTELLDGYAKDGQLEKALRIMSLMEKRGVSPNEYTYTCMVGALAHNNKVRQARKMIAYAASTTSLPTKNRARGRHILTPTYNAFISGLLSDNNRQNFNYVDTTASQSSHATNIVQVLAVLQEMQDLNIHPNVVTVALVVDGLGKCNPPRCKEARELVQHLEFTTRVLQRRQERSSNGYYSGDVDSNDGGKGGISLSSNKIATALIRAYGRANDVESAMEVFGGILPSPDVVAFNALLDAYVRNDELKLALDLFRKHVDFKEWSRREEASSAAASTSNSNSNNAPSLGKFDNENQKQLLFKPDVVTYTAMISGLLQLNSRAATKSAIRFYEEMKSKWWISPDTILVDTILTAMISGGPIGFQEEDVKFTLQVLRDGSRLEEGWDRKQYEKRKKAVRGILVGCSSEIWKNDEYAFGLVSEEQPEDALFRKKGWNKIDSGFRLWGGNYGGEYGDDDDSMQQGDTSSVDSFLASKGWNDIDSGFRLV